MRPRNAMGFVGHHHELSAKAILAMLRLRPCGVCMSLLASRMAVLLRKALVIVAYEWVPDTKVEQNEKRLVVDEGWRVLDEYVQRMGQR